MTPRNIKEEEIDKLIQHIEEFFNKNNIIERMYKYNDLLHPKDKAPFMHETTKENISKYLREIEGCKTGKNISDKLCVLDKYLMLLVLYTDLQTIILARLGIEDWNTIYEYTLEYAKCVIQKRKQRKR
jgi:hypothetical protein